MFLDRDLQTLASDMVAASVGSSSAFEESQMRVGSNLKRCLGDLVSSDEEGPAKDEPKSDESDPDEDSDEEKKVKPVQPAPKKKGKTKWFDRDGAITRAIRKEHGARSSRGQGLESLRIGFV